MKQMKENSPLVTCGKKLTNHSTRKTLVKKLKQAKVPGSEIIKITGHSSEKGLQAYDSGDEAEMRSVSRCHCRSLPTLLFFLVYKKILRDDFQ